MEVQEVKVNKEWEEAATKVWWRLSEVKVTRKGQSHPTEGKT